MTKLAIDKRQLYESIRYCNDNTNIVALHLSESDQKKIHEKILIEQLASSVKISKGIFPTIWKLVEEARQILIPNVKLVAFIRSSPEIQACSYMGTSDTVTIAFTSAIVRLFSENELRFLVGHELGHFLFRHTFYPKPEFAKSRVEELNILALSRASEITADRVGLLAAKSAEDVCKAILKSATGLSDKYINFDFTNYLEQAEELKILGGSEYAVLSTHPTCLTRMKAIMWFEKSLPYMDYKHLSIGNDKYLSKEELDTNVENELRETNGFRLTNVNKKEIDSAFRWGVLAIFLSDKLLSKEEQTLLKQEFGFENATGLISFLRNNGAEAVRNKLNEKLESIRHMSLKEKKQLCRDLSRFVSLAGGDSLANRNVVVGVCEKLGLDFENDILIIQAI